MNIRQIVIEDSEIISFIEAQCFNKLERASYEKIKKRIDVFGQCFLLLSLEGKDIGYIGGMKINSKVIRDEFYENSNFHEVNGKYQSIFSLCVLEEYRGKGYGRDLMNAAIEKAKNEDMDGVVLTCKEEYIGFYEALGYAKLGVSASTHGGATWYDMFYKIL